MTTQTNSQKIGSLGHSIVETQIKASEIWIARNLNEDFGIDIELEYSTDDVKGKFIKAQIRSHKFVTPQGDFVVEPLKKKFLRYVHECRIPIILIVCSTSTSESWFIWLQKWLFESNNISNIYDESDTKTLNIPIHKDHKLVHGLQNEIVFIATWENPTQLLLAVKDLANLSLRLYDEPLANLLFGYLEKFQSANINELGYINVIIEKVIELGLSIWGTDRGVKTAQMLFKFARENGEKFSADHIGKLVLRGNELSRTGINTLGVLYDQFPNHVASLNLAERFKKLDDKRLFLYCTVRERNLGIKSPAWLTSETTDFTVEDLTVNFSQLGMDSFEIWHKWANRGDSMIFDYVFCLKSDGNNSKESQTTTIGD